MSAGTRPFPGSNEAVGRKIGSHGDEFLELGVKTVRLVRHTCLLFYRPASGDLFIRMGRWAQNDNQKART